MTLHKWTSIVASKPPTPLDHSDLTHHSRTDIGHV